MQFFFLFFYPNSWSSKQKLTNSNNRQKLTTIKTKTYYENTNDHISTKLLTTLGRKTHPQIKLKKFLKSFLKKKIKKTDS